ncbi:MAG: rod shape-determining protein RodA [Dictyoglomaceae bacterium]|nr:rod shape-determining protein RodA [Dictyoglomaceae bacterium]
MKNREIRLISIAILLTIIGFFLIYDTTATKLIAREQSPYVFVGRQVVAFVIGVFVFFIFLSIHYRNWEKGWKYLYIINILLLFLVFFFGRETRGAQRWFSIFGFSFQPSELAKLLVILSISGFFVELKTKKKYLDFVDFAVSIILISIPTLAVILQPDLGTAIVIMATGFFLIYLSEIPFKYLVRTVLLIIVLLPFFWLLLKPYQQERIISFLDPMKDPLGSGYQVIQSIITIGSGKVLGKGWLKGPQTHLNLIPEQHTDFIFSAIGEEFGFIGGVLLILLYYLLFRYTWYIWKDAKDDFGKMISGGILFTWFFQVFVNLCMVMGLAPVVGIPLPFISFARTSLITNYAMLSFLINISIRGEKKIYDRF